MFGISDDSLTSIEFRLKWEKQGVRHTDALYAQRVNFWRDLLPDGLRRDLMGALPGDAVSQVYGAGDILPLPNERRCYSIPHNRIVSRMGGGTPLTPRYGRFYPRGILRGVPGVSRLAISAVCL